MMAEHEVRWRPQSEAEILAAIDDGLLEETHYLDVKRQVGSTASQRKETARDLASFAIDGGCLLVGIEEVKNSGSWVTDPQVLDGLPEKIEQVARSVIDPPLFITASAIKSDADPTLGYVYVDIPPSATAPHMVDGTYYGRGDKTKIRLSDSEIVRHHAARRSQEDLAASLLEAEFDRDPIRPAANGTGRLYIVAQPLTAPRDLAVEVVRSSGDDVYSVINGIEHKIPSKYRDWWPGPADASTSASRAQGVARCSEVTNGPGRTYVADMPGADESRLLDVELREDGGIRVLVGRMTPNWGPDQTADPVIADGLAAIFVLRTIHWATEIAERTGYRGAWVFGVLATGLRGLSSAAFKSGRRFDDGPKYDADEYREVTSATGLELSDRPWAVADRLVGRLVRALRSSGEFGPLLSDPEVE